VAPLGTLQKNKIGYIKNILCFLRRIFHFLNVTKGTIDSCPNTFSKKKYCQDFFQKKKKSFKMIQT
jgi:hypothetical protein